MNIPNYYKTKWMLIGIPICSFLATFIGTPHTFSEPILYTKIGYNLFIAALIWMTYLGIVLFLDKKMPWESTPELKRWAWQIGLSFPLGILIDWGGVLIRNHLLAIPFLPHLFLYTDVPVLLLFTIILPYLYRKWYLAHYYQTLSMDAKDSTILVPERLPFSVKKGNKVYQISIEDICYFYRKDQYNFLRESNGNEYILDQSLTAIEQQLDTHLFFRINRQLLVNRQAIQSYKILPSRQIALSLSPVFETGALLNKNRSAQFKKWIQGKG